MSAKCIKRLQQEYKDMKANKADNAEAAPEEEDLLTWYFVLDGPKGTPYEGGEYLGRIKFPNNYPFAPPSYFVCTPNGRFQTETSICTSFSSYHSDQWTPAWNVSTILQGLLSFMVENASTAGSITTDDATKKSLAKSSWNFNVKHSRYKNLFPERFEKASAKLERIAKGAADDDTTAKKKTNEEKADDAVAGADDGTKKDQQEGALQGNPKNELHPESSIKNVQVTNNKNNNNNNNNTDNNNNNNNNNGVLDRKYAYLLLGIAAGAAIVAKFL